MSDDRDVTIVIIKDKVLKDKKYWNITPLRFESPNEFLYSLNNFT